MFGALKTWFTALSTIAKVGVVSGAVVAGAATSSAVSGNSPQPPKQPPCTASTSTTTETQALPFSKTSVDDPTSATGTSKIITAGVPGEKVITYQVTTHTPAACKEDTKTEVSAKVTKDPVNEVTAVGTYVAPPAPSCENGSYTNSDGIEVCSPSSNPSGATARCVDGTYSYSLHHSGTCSHHGGVAEWL